MRRLIPAVRISAGLASLCVSAVFVAVALGLMPDRLGAVVAGRVALVENLAVFSSLSVQKNDMPGVRAVLESAAMRNKEIVSIGLRGVDGALLADVRDHGVTWAPLAPNVSTETQLQVPLQRNGQPWATLEIAFQPAAGGLFSRDSLLPFVAFLGSACFVAYFLFVRRVFFSGGDGGAVPSRVRAAMNTLAEGVLILDNADRIAMANDAFAKLVDTPPDELSGKRVSELPFFADTAAAGEPMPWEMALNGKQQIGVPLALRSEQRIPTRLSINATPILGDDGVQRGALTTFDNLTSLERKHAQLRKVLANLRHSRKLVRKQNQELRALATRDPLTGCFNRRTLFSEFEKHWESTKRFQNALSVIMVDVDHFKSINDKHGHAVGDEVLKGVAETLKQAARKVDLVARYGGEEFCVLLPQIDADGAFQASERLREALAAGPIGGVPVTASLGVSSVGFGARHPQELLEQADKALYAAKRGGRNRSQRYDQIPLELANIEEKPKKPKDPSVAVKRPKTRAVDLRPATPSTNAEMAVPYQAVSGLLAALAFRHSPTAEHCRRVADLIVSTGGGVMSQKELYVVEMAALLHDIGKLGLPDSVLLKDASLTADEWKTLRMHENVGIEIIRAAFTSDELVEIVRCQHCWYGGSLMDPGLPKGAKIPMGSRLLAIADAYDSMVTEQPFRVAMTREEAFEEMRRCAGTQFDPILVEHFIGTLSETAGTQKAAKAMEKLTVSKQVALKLGVQMEKLAMAVDVQDVQALTTMAGQLRTLALENGIPRIAELAGRLETQATPESDHMDLVEVTIELLELCRQTQRALLPVVEKKKRSQKSLAEMEMKRIKEPTPIALTRPSIFLKRSTEIPLPPRPDDKRT